MTSYQTVKHIIIIQRDMIKHIKWFSLNPDYPSLSLITRVHSVISTEMFDYPAVHNKGYLGSQNNHNGVFILTLYSKRL